MATSSERIVAGLRRLGARVDVVQMTGGRAGVEVQPEHGGQRIFSALGEDIAHGLNLLWSSCLSPRANTAPRYSHLLAFGGQVPLLAGPVFAAWLGAPLLTLLRGNDFDSGVFQPQRRGVLDDAIRRAARVVTVSRDMQARVLALHPQAAVEVIANGIAPDAWQALPSDRARAAAWRAETVPAGRLLLGCVGQIKAKKGGVFLLEALLAAGLEQRVHLAFVGEVDAEVRNCVAGHAHVSASFHALMDRYALIPVYLGCDAVALPSWYDGMPNVLLEAGALGVPVLASRAGGIGDVIDRADLGWTFAPGDLPGCAAALTQWAGLGGADRAAAGLALKHRVLRDFHAEREAGAYMALLQMTGATVSATGDGRCAAGGA
jgi:glycosyltransferase involved in cell wall biosynthesis